MAETTVIERLNNPSPCGQGDVIIERADLLLVLDLLEECGRALAVLHPHEETDLALACADCVREGELVFRLRAAGVSDPDAEEV